jgi:hypothetical protein
VHAGTIAIRSGNPHDEDPWEWHCGFYPGSHPGEHQSGTAATFDQARCDFEAAWEVFLANRTQADFRAWRDQRDWTARKYETWTTGEKLPLQEPSSMIRCPCGEMFDSHRLENTLIHVPHITAEHKSREVRRPRPFGDPEAAVRKLIEIANAAEPVQDARIYIERVNGPFLAAGGSSAEYRAGIERAIAKGWLWRHESGTYVKFTDAGAELFA